MTIINWRMRLTIGVAATCAAYLALPPGVTAQRSEAAGRAPFQIQLSATVDPTAAWLSRRFGLPAGRRLEIHNVNVRLSLLSLPQRVSSECTVSAIGPLGGSLASLPFVLRRPTEPLAESDGSEISDWVAAQPTLLHVFPGQRVTCFLERFPVKGGGVITWTISGFTDDAQ